MLDGLRGLEYVLTDVEHEECMVRRLKYEEDGLICEKCLFLNVSEENMDSVYCDFLEFVEYLRSKLGFIVCTHQHQTFSSLYLIRQRATKVVGRDQDKENKKENKKDKNKKDKKKKGKKQKVVKKPKKNENEPKEEKKMRRNVLYFLSLHPTRNLLVYRHFR